MTTISKTTTDQNSDFELARALYERSWFKPPEPTAATVKSLILDDHLEQYGIPQTYDCICDFLAPETDNIVIDHFANISRPERPTIPSLRDLVFREPKTYAETGSEGNRRLARILNTLADSQRPKDALIRTDDTVIRLPQDPSKIREAQRAQEKAGELASRKLQTLSLFKNEVLKTLFRTNGPTQMSQSLISNLRWFENNVEGGKDLSQAVTAVVTDLGIIGYLANQLDFSSALDVFSRTDQRSLKASEDLTAAMT